MQFTWITGVAPPNPNQTTHTHRGEGGTLTIALVAGWGKRGFEDLAGLDAYYSIDYE